MAYKLQLKRGLLASLPNGSVGEPLFTTDTFDLYVGKGDGSNIKLQKFIASGSSSQFLKGDGSLDSTTYQGVLSGSGIVKSTGGTISYLTDNSSNWDAAYNDKINSASVSGTTTKTLTLTQQDGGTITASWSDYDTAPVTSVFGRTGDVIAVSGDYTTSLVTEGTNLYFTDARARAAITLTTTGSSGSATYVGGTLNVPTYTLSGLGGVPTSRSLTINGTSYDLSADRSWSVGTVTSVDLSVPTGFAISGNPITSSGTLALAFASGYSLPTNASQTNWDAAYNDKINSASVTGTTTKTLTLNQQDGGTITASWTDDNTDAVTSVFGRTGAVVAASGDYTTTQVTEGTNLYYTEARVSANTDVAANTAARHNAVTLGTANGLSLSTQQLSLALASGSTTGALSSTDWTTFNSKQAALNGTGFVKISGTTISYDNSTYYLASNPSSYIAKTDLSAITPLSYDNVTGVFQMSQANSTTSGYITSTDWNTFNNKQSALTNPVTGTGTTNYLPKFTGSTTIGNSSVQTDSNGNIGINTAPVSYGSTYTTLTLNNASTGSYSIFQYGGITYGQIGVENSIFNIQAANSAPIVFNVSSAERMRLTTTGLGIGTTSPSVKLDVVGAGMFSSTLTVKSFLYLGESLVENGVINSPEGIFINADSDASGGSNDIVFGKGRTSTSGGTTLMTLKNNGNLGLGTSSPTSYSGFTTFNINNATNGGVIDLLNNGTRVGTFFNTASDVNLGSITSVPLIFYTANTEKMRLTSGGSLGIGTTSPGGTYGKLSVAGGIRILDDNNGKLEIGRYSAGASNSYIKLGANSNSLRFTNAADLADIMELTNSGNLGLGVTPSAWSTLTGFQVKNAALSGYLNRMYLFGNAYYGSGDFRYIASDYATLYQQSDGEHRLFTAPSGTAGNAISFTQAMTLDASGNLMVGTTTSSGKLTVSGTSYLDGDVTVAAAKQLYLTSGDLRYSSNAGFGIVSQNGTRLVSIQNGAFGVTGVATFSSSVTAGQLYTYSNAAASGFLQFLYASANSSSRSWRLLNDHVIYGDFGIQQSTTQTGSTYQTRLYINDVGNVGIGVTATDYKLEVNGAIKAKGNIVTDLNSQIDSALYGTGQLLTSATEQPIIYLESTWNTTGNARGIEYRVTNTASGASSKLLNLLVGGVSMFNVSKNGNTVIGGDLLVGTTSEAGYVTIQNPTANKNGLNVICSATTASNYVLNLQSNASVANTAYLIRGYSNTSTGVFFVAGNGNVTNTNNSYGAISDVSLKENIIDATSKLNDLLKVKVRNYNLIGDDKKQIGVIAQELETIFPSMIDTDKETGLKSVKYSVFVPMLVKAIQELKAEIEQLKNK